MRTSILVDQPRGWIAPWAARLGGELTQLGHSSPIVNSQEQIPDGDICFFLGCTKIVKEPYLSRNPMNIVVHPSDLPKGRGFSPLAWQVLEGCNQIPVCLFSATPKVDEGLVYLRDLIRLDGTELNDEIKHKQGEMALSLCLRFIREFDSLRPQVQEGSPSYYPRRTALDSQLDLDASLRSQFPLLRVVDNERYPAFFILNGQKYLLRIEKAPAPASKE